MHEGIETFIGLLLACVGEVEGDHGGCELGMAQGALDKPGVHASFEQMGGVGMSQGMDSHPCFGKAGALFGCAEGALHTGATHGRKCCRTLLLIAPGRGKEPSRVTRGFPGGAEQREGVFGQGDVPVLGALAAVDMDLKTLAVNIGDLKVKGFMEPQSSARDGGKGDLIVQRRGGREEPPDLLHAEDGGEPVSGLRTQER